MLWLPKWMRVEERPTDEGVSRRTFLCLGAAAGVGLLLPEPLDITRTTYPLSWGRNLTYGGVPVLYDRSAMPMRELYGRIAFELDTRRPDRGAWVQAVDDEYAGLIADLSAPRRST